MAKTIVFNFDKAQPSNCEYISESHANIIRTPGIQKISIKITDNDVIRMCENIGKLYNVKKYTKRCINRQKLYEKKHRLGLR